MVLNQRRDILDHAADKLEVFTDLDDRFHKADDWVGCVGADVALPPVEVLRLEDFPGAVLYK